MDSIRAQNLAKSLVGNTFCGFEVLSLINNGKSAAVFKVKRDAGFFALKVFDDELVERFGHEIQIKRIEQEISLKNHNINNLVKIHDGGFTMLSGLKYYYIIMELIVGQNLKEHITSNSYDKNFIIKVLKTLNQITTDLLNQKSIVHRDIKPENIMIASSGNITLMDLGVLKLIGAKSFSDEEEKSFVGTLRYAPPEFLLRTEQDSMEGWKAVNYYQIGATLHDLIMKKELFKDKIPYSNLVIAIKDDIPIVSNAEMPFELLQITRDMLTKDWKIRLSLINEERISKMSGVSTNSIEESIDTILKMRMGHQAKFEEIESLKRTKEELRKKRNEVGSKIFIAVNDCFSFIQQKEICKEIKTSTNFLFETEKLSRDPLYQNYLYELKGSLSMGFSRALFVLVSITNDETNFTEINVTGFLATSGVSNYTEVPMAFFENIYRDIQPHQRNTSFPHFNKVNIFKGIVEFDASFVDHLKTQILKLIAKGLTFMEKEVTEELQSRERAEKSSSRINIRMNSMKFIVVDSI